MGFPSPCPSSETPSASAPPRLKDICDGSPLAGKEEGEEEEAEKEVKEGGEKGEEETKNQYKLCYGRADEES